MTTASDNVFPKIIVAEGAAPATPSTGEVKLYAKTDGLLYSKDDAGTETLVSGGSGGGLTHAYAGYNTTGGSNETMTTRRVYAKKITLASSGTIVSVGAAVKSDGASHVGSLGVAVYADSTGTPGKLLSYVMPTVTGLLPEVSAGSTSYGWVHVPTGLYCASGDYWIAVFDMSPTNTIVIAYDGSGSDRYYTSGGNWVTDWGFYTPTTSSNKYSIRASVLS